MGLISGLLKTTVSVAVTPLAAALDVAEAIGGGDDTGRTGRALQNAVEGLEDACDGDLV